MKLYGWLSAIIYFASFGCLAGQEKLFVIGTTNVLIHRDTKYDVLVSSDCNPSKQCDALKKLNKIKPVAITLYGGVNTGSYVCRTQLSGHVVIGIDENKNENSFCKFNDSSLIDVGSLTFLEKKAH